MVKNTSDWLAQFDIVLHYVRKLTALPRFCLVDLVGCYSKVLEYFCN